MAWPPKIATAKPHERPSAFDKWYQTLDDDDLRKIVKLDVSAFDMLNRLLKVAFEAGRKSK